MAHPWVGLPAAAGTQGAVRAGTGRRRRHRQLPWPQWPPTAGRKRRTLAREPSKRKQTARI